MKPQKPIRRSPIKRKSISAEKKAFKTTQREEDIKFYLEIWEEREHKCEACDIYLGNEPLTIYFDHLLEKSKYIQLRYDKANIALVCMSCHSNKSISGPITERYRQLIDAAKEIFFGRQ